MEPLLIIFSQEMLGFEHMKVALYSNEVIPPKMRLEQYIYSYADVWIAFLPIVLDKAVKKKHLATIMAYYHKINIKDVEYFDFFENSSINSLSQLKDYDIYHFSGGNTLETLQMWKNSPLESFFHTQANEGKLFIGHCGGAVLLSSNASWIRLLTEPLGRVLDDRPAYQALGLANFEFIPHYNRFKKDPRFLETLREYSIGINTPIYSCNDGDGLLLDSGQLNFYGNLVKIFRGKITPVK